MTGDFFQIKLRNEATQEYICVYGKVDYTAVKFAHNKKANIYGEIKQSYVSKRKKIMLNIEYMAKEDYDKVEKWWFNTNNITIEQDNKIPILCVFTDSEYALKEEINTEDGDLYYTGTLNFE